ncbi:MAG TPA: DUF2239 family protein [Gemmataceae bacterium]|jgi:hypothetical protein|nr:DUF2239 family protein [Gemmataceae bacterium]
MDTPEHTYCTAFEGYRRIASGDLAQVVLKTKAVIDRGEKGPVLIFDDVTSEPIEVDFRGTSDDVLKRLPRAPLTESATPEEPGPRGPGRPRLGVVAREVTLLPRHWHWLNDQPGGASVALRKLVEEARRANEGKDRIRRLQESAYKFMSAMAGNLPGFEEATRALFAGNGGRFEELIGGWPKDIRSHLERLTKELLGSEIAATTADTP